MNGTPFKLATIARVNTSTKPFAALVLGDEAIDLSAAHTAYRAARGGPTLSATAGIPALLEDWDANFAVLQALPLIAEANPQAGLLMESLMATVAQSDKEAKRRIRAFLDRKTAKVKPGP